MHTSTERGKYHLLALALLSFPDRDRRPTVRVSFRFRPQLVLSDVVTSGSGLTCAHRRKVDSM